MKWYAVILIFAGLVLGGCKTKYVRDRKSVV